jgi:hypothetical protein
MDNTAGEHVIVSRLVAGDDGRSRFENAFLPYDQVLGPLRQSTTIEASSICFRAWPGDHTGTLGSKSAPSVILVLEGSAKVESGRGESRRFTQGDVLEIAANETSDIGVCSADGLPFRGAEILFSTAPSKIPDGASRPKSEQGLPFVRNVTGDDNRSHFHDGTLPYFTEGNGSLVTEYIAISRFQYVYAASDLRYDFHNAPQRQIVLPLTGGTQGENSDGSRRVIPPGGVYFGEDTTGEGHITSAVNDAIRFSIFAHLV